MQVWDSNSTWAVIIDVSQFHDELFSQSYLRVVLEKVLERAVACHGCLTYLKAWAKIDVTDGHNSRKAFCVSFGETSCNIRAADLFI